MSIDPSRTKQLPRNFLRLLSLFIALVMWVSLSGRKEGPDNRVVKSFNVQLVQHGVPANMKLNSDEYQILVTLSGDDKEMSRVQAFDIEVRQDLQGYEPGTYNMPLTEDNVTLPTLLTSLAVEDIQPRVVRLGLERKITKSVEIFMATEGVPADDYELEELVLVPEQAILEGPESKIEDVDILIAKPINIGDAQESIAGRVNFDFNNQVPRDTAIVNLNDLTFVATIKEKRKKIKIAKPVALRVIKADEEQDVKFDVSKVKVEVDGPVTIMRWFKEEWLMPSIYVPSDVVADTVLSVVFDWNVPEEAALEMPDWESRVAELVLVAEPAEVKANPQ